MLDAGATKVELKLGLRRRTRVLTQQVEPLPEAKFLATKGVIRKSLLRSFMKRKAVGKALVVVYVAVLALLLLNLLIAIMSGTYERIGEVGG